MKIQLTSLFSDGRASGTEFEVQTLETAIDAGQFFLRMLSLDRYFDAGIRRVVHVYDGPTVVWAASGWLPPGGY